MKYTTETIEAITKALTELKGRVQACKEAGIHYSTFLDWFKNKPEFSERIKEAEAQANDTGREFAIKSIFKAMQDGKWQAAAWWLERNFKDEFALRQEVTGKNGEAVRVNAESADYSKLTEEELEELLRLERKAKGISD